MLRFLKFTHVCLIMCCRQGNPCDSCLPSLWCRQDNVGDSCSVFMQPVMLFNPGKISSTSRLLFERGIAMVVVGFPATPLLSARARICISASHSREDLDWALQVPRPPAFMPYHAFVFSCHPTRPVQQACTSTWQSPDSSACHISSSSPQPAVHKAALRA